MGKNLHNDTLLDCYACAHSQQGFFMPTLKPLLMCSLSLHEATERCNRFEYEPGSDQGERNA